MLILAGEVADADARLCPMRLGSSIGRIGRHQLKADFIFSGRDFVSDHDSVGKFASQLQELAIRAG